MVKRNSLQQHFNKSQDDHRPHARCCAQSSEQFVSGTWIMSVVSNARIQPQCSITTAQGQPARLLCRFQVFRTHSTFMPKWISVLFSHCIKWTRVLVPVPLQRPRGLLCWRRHRLCLCWRLGFSTTGQDETLQPSLCALAQQLNSWPKWMCENHGATRGGRGRAQGLQGRRSCSSGCGVSEPGPGGAGPGSVIALFFLTDCAGIPGLQTRACCG